jgi:hypothetical protein
MPPPSIVCYYCVLPGPAKLRCVGKWLTSALSKKRQDVAGDEDLCQSRGPDDGMPVRLKKCDETPQSHVNRRGEEVRAQQKEDRLYDVRHFREVGGLSCRQYAADIAYSFDCQCIRVSWSLVKSILPS